MTSFWKIDRFRANRAHVAARKQATRRSAFEPREAALALADETAKDTKRVALVSREAIAETRRVYNIEVEGAHTYFVGDGDGVLAHNKCNECGAAWYNVGHAIFGCPVANARNHEKMQNLGLTAFSAVDEVQTHENAEWAEEATIELASALPGTDSLLDAATVTDSNQPLSSRLYSAAFLSAPILKIDIPHFGRRTNSPMPKKLYSYIGNGKKFEKDGKIFVSTTGRVYMSEYEPGPWLTSRSIKGTIERVRKTGKFKPLNDKDYFVIENTELFKPCARYSIAFWKNGGGQYYTDIGITGFKLSENTITSGYKNMKGHILMSNEPIPASTGQIIRGSAVFAIERLSLVGFSLCAGKTSWQWAYSYYVMQCNKQPIDK